MRFVTLGLLVCFSMVSAIPSQRLGANNDSNRIVGGMVASEGQFPYQAGIYMMGEDGITYFCGGALINNDWILTAAHCVIRATSIQIALGSVSLTNDDPNRLIDFPTIYRYHLDYTPSAVPPTNDLGLIQLSSPPLYNEFIKPIGLPVSNVATGVDVVVAGWGATTDAEGLVDNLRYVHIKTISNTACESHYLGSTITDGMVCASAQAYEGVCDGDNGSPLARSGVNTVDGIVLFTSSNGCNTKEPSGFTRVFPYVSWIQEIINE